jgi:hypothetical protein
MANFNIKIDGNYLPVGVKVKTKTLKISYDQAGTRGVLSFTLIDLNPSNRDLFYFTAIIGKKVEVFEDGILIYGGKILDPKTEKINPLPVVKQEFSCVDWHEICDRIKINQGFGRYEISELIKVIIDNHLSVDGIWYDSNSIKPTTKYISINCPYISATQVFNELCELCGFQWYIGPDKKFYFNDRTVEVGPSVNEFSGYLWSSFSMRDDISEYRNVQVYQDVNAVTDELLETANPNPEDNRSYYVQFKLNNKPKIYITLNRNNPPQEDQVDPSFVGINGLDSGVYWYWSKNENIITQDGNQDPIPSGYYLVLKYYGQYKINIIERNNSQIAERQSIEGGSGLYYNIESGSGIEGITIAENKAQAVLDKYGDVSKSIDLESYSKVWQIGQICDTVFPNFKINSLVVDGNGYLVSKLTIQDMGINLQFKRSVTLVSGQVVGGWVNFFRKWLSSENEFMIREDAIVSISNESNESMEWDGEVVINKYTCLYPLDDPGGLYPSNLLYPGSLSSTRTEND